MVLLPERLMILLEFATGRPEMEMVFVDGRVTPPESSSVAPDCTNTVDDAAAVPNASLFVASKNPPSAVVSPE